MSLFAELRRRNVIRMAGLYLVGAWLVVQVSETLLPIFDTPGWVLKSLVVLLALGFVPVLVFSWLYELTPDGLKREGEVDRSQSIVAQTARKLDIAVIVLLLAVGGMLAWTHGQRPAAVAPAALPSSATPVVASRPGSVAVLPFSNRSADPDTAYFVDGVHDDLLTQLARNPALKVISRTSMMEYRNTTKNLRQIGQELGVANLLEGAVQRSGQRVRINAQLIDAATDAHLWAETFDRELTPENVFEIQSEIAAAISHALGKTLAGATAGSAPTRNAKAYDLYLRARAQSGKVGEAEIRELIALYREVQAEDPEFALAMGELGLELTNLYWFYTRDAAERDEARQWIDRALKLDPEHPRLRWILARHLYHAQLDYDAALEQLVLAEKGLPGSADVFMLRAWILRRAGRPAEAIEALNTAATLDPRADEVLSSLVETHALLGDLDAAQRWHKRMAAIPGFEAASYLAYPGTRFRVLGEAESLARGLALAPSAYLGFYVGYRFDVPFLQRDFARSEQAIAEYPVELLEDQSNLIPKPLMRARLARARGQADLAGKFAADALAVLEDILVREPEDYRALMSKALALAILGRGNEARASARQAIAAPTPSKDVVLRAELRAEELRVLAMIVGTDELARAFDDYQRLEMKRWHFDGLMLDPVFDPHRGHPAMQALANRYSRKPVAEVVAP